MTIITREGKHYLLQVPYVNNEHRTDDCDVAVIELKVENIRAWHTRIILCRELQTAYELKEIVYDDWSPDFYPREQSCTVCGEPDSDGEHDHDPDAEPAFCDDCGAELTHTGSCDNDHADADEPGPPRWGDHAARIDACTFHVREGHVWWSALHHYGDSVHIETPRLSADDLDELARRLSELEVAK